MRYNILFRLITIAAALIMQNDKDRKLLAEK
jgi:hypothetical protein